MTSTFHPDDVVLMLTTCPDDERADVMAGALVEARLAACVNVLPPMISHYWWQGHVERATERQLAVKTTRAHVAAVEAFLVEHHPYQLPECLVVAVADGSTAYLHWVRTETGARGATR
jgi:periplasmic divalent cation tolerance protein